MAHINGPKKGPSHLHGSPRSEVQSATSAVEWRNSRPVFGRENFHSKLPSANSSNSSNTPTVPRRRFCPGQAGKIPVVNDIIGIVCMQVIYVSSIPQTRWSKFFFELRHITCSNSLCLQSTPKSHGFENQCSHMFPWKSPLIGICSNHFWTLDFRQWPSKAWPTSFLSPVGQRWQRWQRKAG